MHACVTTQLYTTIGRDLQKSWTPFPKFPVRSYLYYLTICVKYAKETKCIKGKGVHWKTERQPPSVVPILHGDPHNHEATQGAGGLTGDILQMFLQSAFPIDMSALAAGLVFILRESHTSNYVKAES